MKAAFRAVATLLLLSLTVAAPCKAQQNEPCPFLANFPFENTVPLKIIREAIPSRPFSVVGPRGAFLGLQDGSFEASISRGRFQQSSRQRGDEGLSRTHRCQ